MINETPIMTEANKKVLAIKRRKAAVPDRVFSLDTLRSNAEILDECGGAGSVGVPGDSGKLLYLWHKAERWRLYFASGLCQSYRCAGQATATRIQDLRTCLRSLSQSDFDPEEKR